MLDVDIKNNIFFGKDVVKLDEKDPSYQQDLVNSYTSLENHFFELVDKLILKEYNDEELCKNTVKFSIFINMLNLYHIYVAIIQRSKDLDCACLESNVAIKIKNGTVVRLLKNSKTFFSKKNNDDRKYYVLNLETFALRVEMAFNPSEQILKMLENKKNKSIKEKCVNFFKKESNLLDEINEKLAECYK